MTKLILSMFTMLAVTAAIAESTAQKYTCLMHPEVMTDAPGDCPKCGMPLVPVKAEKKRRTPNAERPMSKSEEEAQQPHEMAMASSLNLADPMSRESSGSSWVPDSTPIYGRMLMFGDDMLMLHGAIFPRYVNANTRRGDDRIDAPNWFMAMYSHPFSDSAQLGFRGMMSLDLLTEGGRGYPLLFQTGETWNGKALHDRQHPHDLFDEISVSYSQKFGADFSAYLYAGNPGARAWAAGLHAPALGHG
jgi:hypothetical protein